MQNHPPPRIRIVVADDHPSIRENLRSLLGAEPDLDVVGVARNGLEALHMTLDLRPDVVVLDQDMPVLSGAEVAARLRREPGTVRVVLYTLEEEAGSVTQREGAVVVSKDAPTEELLRAIRQGGSGAQAPPNAPLRR